MQSIYLYNKKTVWYNLDVKKFAALTISLLTALTSAGGITANAANGGTIYPEDDEFIKTLTLPSLTDYAVEGELYAFTDGADVKVYNDGEYYEYRFENAVTNVDINEGVIYCGVGEKAYTVPEQTECEYTFPAKTDELTYNGYYYFIDGEGINVFDKTSKTTTTFEGEYVNIKQDGEKVYAVSGNTLYSFTGAERSEVVLKYADYAATHQILIGQARTALQTYSEARFVQIAQGSFMTEIDLEKLDGVYFTPVKTVRAEENATALLLCESGTAAIVSIGNTGYILLKSKISETDVDFSTENKFNAQMIGGKIYASPYIASGTELKLNATGINVKVLRKLEDTRAENEKILESVFYEIEYGTGSESVKGYVAEGFLSQVMIDDNKTPTEIVDPEYSEKNDTKTILIIFAVVLLVLAAIGYITHVSSRGKKKSKKKSKDKDGEE